MHDSHLDFKRSLLIKFNSHSTEKCIATYLLRIFYGGHLEYNFEKGENSIFYIWPPAGLD